MKGKERARVGEAYSEHRGPIEKFGLRGQVQDRQIHVGIVHVLAIEDYGLQYCMAPHCQIAVARELVAHSR